MVRRFDAPSSSRSSEAAKAEKSCSPSSSGAARVIGAFVERIRVMVDEMAIERRTYFIAEDAVFVSLAAGVEARMKAWVRFANSADADRAGQKPVYGPPEILRRDGVLERNRGDLRQCMDARVGPAGAVDLDRLAFDAADHFLKDTLNGRQTRLNLPAVEVGSVVGDLKPQTSHTRREPGFTTGMP